MPRPTKQPSKLLTYPTADAFRAGCKVSFYYYRDEAVAKQASDIAKHNGVVRAAAGYDTGYRTAGELTRVARGEHAGMWEVVIP